MGKLHVILIITILVLGGFALFLDIPGDSEESGINLMSGKAVKDIPKDNEENNLEDNINENIDSEEPRSETSLDPDSPSSSLSEDSNDENPPSLPDIENSPCGFYFDVYEICGGFCPDGECISEGDSCYCKLE